MEQDNTDRWYRWRRCEADLPRLLASMICASPRLIRFIAGSMWRSSVSPSGVSCTRLVLRINRVIPSFFSSTLTDWLTADWEINSCLEASEKLRRLPHSKILCTIRSLYPSFLISPPYNCFQYNKILWVHPVFSQK